MERRYLVATLALVATFAIFSRGFQSGHLAALPCSQAELRADLACARQYVAEKLVAKIQPFVNRGVPEEAQMVAELNLPVLAAVQEKVAATAIATAERTAEKNCDAARRAQEAAARAQELTARANERAQEISERVNLRAQELSFRANERAMEMNARAMERAERINASAMQKAQRSLDRSRMKLTPPPAPSLPMPINFVIDSPSDFALPMQVSLENRLVVQNVQAQVAAQQIRVMTTQRANQNLVKNVRIVVNKQDVSGLGSWTELSAARTVSRQVERAIQHFLQNILRIIERTFATL